MHAGIVKSSPQWAGFDAPDEFRSFEEYWSSLLGDGALFQQVYLGCRSGSASKTSAWAARIERIHSSKQCASPNRVTGVRPTAENVDCRKLDSGGRDQAVRLAW